MSWQLKIERNLEDCMGEMLNGLIFSLINIFFCTDMRKDIEKLKWLKRKIENLLKFMF
jgi:hypothetical protein